jgi:hypothetical protein
MSNVSKKQVRNMQSFPISKIQVLHGNRGTLPTWCVILILSLVFLEEMARICYFLLAVEVISVAPTNAFRDY